MLGFPHQLGDMQTGPTDNKIQHTHRQQRTDRTDPTGMHTCNFEGQARKWIKDRYMKSQG